MTEVGVARGISGELGFVNKFQMILRGSLSYKHCSAPSVESETCSAVSDSSRSHGLQPTRFLCLWNFPGKNTGVGCHALLQGIFQTQGLNLDLVHCRPVLYCLSHLGSPVARKGHAIYMLIFGVSFISSSNFLPGNEFSASDAG